MLYVNVIAFVQVEWPKFTKGKESIMATVGDFHIMIEDHQDASMRFGYTDERRAALNAAAKKVRQAIKKQYRRRTLDLDGLHNEDPLDEKAQAAFDEFVTVVHQPGGCAWPIGLTQHGRL